MHAHAMRTQIPLDAEALKRKLLAEEGLNPGRNGKEHDLGADGHAGKTASSIEMLSQDERPVAQLLQVRAHEAPPQTGEGHF